MDVKWASGNWLVKEGSEEEFVARWNSDDSKQKFGAAKDLCDEFMGGNFERAASFSSAAASA